jgi:hypothetical protein
LLLVAPASFWQLGKTPADDARDGHTKAALHTTVVPDELDAFLLRLHLSKYARLLCAYVGMKFPSDAALLTDADLTNAGIDMLPAERYRLIIAARAIAAKEDGGGDGGCCTCAAACAAPQQHVSCCSCSRRWRAHRRASSLRWSRA